MLSFFSSRRKWDSPTPHLQASLPPPPPPGSGRRGTLAGKRGVGGVPIPTRGHTLWYSLYIRTLWCTYCACHQLNTVTLISFVLHAIATLIPAHVSFLWLWSGAENMKLFNISGWNWRIIARHFDIRQTMSQQQQQQFLSHTVHTAFQPWDWGQRVPSSLPVPFKLLLLKNSWVVSAHSKHLKISPSLFLLPINL